MITEQTHKNRFLAVPLLLIVSFLFWIPRSYAQQDPEILIIGALHQVSSIAKGCYGPLLKQAIKYAPDAILTEDIMPGDTLSLQVYTPKFLQLADSLSKAEPVDETKFQEVLRKGIRNMNAEDYQYLSQAFLKKRDRANYTYYQYLEEYGLNGSKKSQGNENDDLIFKLAIEMNQSTLYPIDDHQTDNEYNSAWQEAVVSGADNGDYNTFMKLEKKLRKGMIVPAILGRLGKYANKLSVLENYHKINSVRYAEHPNEKTESAKSLWDGRNKRMAKHIISTIQETGLKRYVLVVGAGHVISLKNALNQLDSKLKVRLMDE